jgi:hypothetical protein
MSTNKLHEMFHDICYRIKCQLKSLSLQGSIFKSNLLMGKLNMYYARSVCLMLLIFGFLGLRQISADHIVIFHTIQWNLNEFEEWRLLGVTSQKNAVLHSHRSENLKSYLNEFVPLQQTQHSMCFLPPHLKMETDPVSITTCILVFFRMPDEEPSSGTLWSQVSQKTLIEFKQDTMMNTNF